MTSAPDPLDKIEELAKRAERRAKARDSKVSSFEQTWEEILERNGFREMIRALGKGGG